jgi:hypothetical protein
MNDHDALWKPIGMVKIILLIASLTTAAYAEPKPKQQLCDGKKQTCCLAIGFDGIVMWVSDDACPKGMTDNSSCEIQYKCQLLK